ncbi:RNA polymerase sigma-70 factor [Pedobacter sp. KR3-3]|uniref:RNA polymerase sigma-70 factor n=1 Tax=Pedobacter albus TaxID=3113905 RepID=A0ABU7IAY2_9SPHI|nr:RNA polymerase sigma-70 factor [Pedobacter sp. KR3-3]MEE1946632.1 RNA polymerase sigma-70 factor [Pedobacter sp. KR3-3]
MPLALQQSFHENASDHELLKLVGANDRLAFTELYNRYWDKAFAVAMHRTADEDVATEIVQDIFVSLWQRRADLQIKNGIATYLSAAIKYKVINHLASQYKQQQHLVNLANSAPQTTDSTNDWLAEKELRQLLGEAINQLPPKCKMVFLMSREENKTYAEIASELGISEKTVEAHLSKALSSLRQSLKISLPLLLFLLGK